MEYLMSRRYGGPAPCVAGSIALDLHRMSRIIEVNEKFSYAVVEPGVTFGDLYTHCAKEKLKVWPSTASLGWGSVIGNVSSLILQPWTSTEPLDSRPWHGLRTKGHPS